MRHVVETAGKEVVTSYLLGRPGGKAGELKKPREIRSSGRWREGTDTGPSCAYEPNRIHLGVAG